MHRRALAIRLKALGEDHPDTATSYNNLAATLGDQGKYAEAEAMHRRALAIRLKALGEGHPDTATSYNNLAATLHAQGKHAEAEAMYRRALAIRLKALGEGHPDTALSYSNLAWSLDRQGKHDDALRTWAAAAASYEQARLLGAKGLEAALRQAALRSPPSPRPWPAPGSRATPGRAGSRGLARGLIDEVTRRAARPLTAAEHDREAGLLGQAQAIDERISKLLAAQGAHPGARQDPRGPPAAGERAPPPVARAGAAVRGQVRRPGQPARHARRRPEGPPRGDGPRRLDRHEDRTTGPACCGHSGDPVWVRLAGSGKDGAWTKEEEGSGATPPRRARSRNHQGQRRPAGRGAGAAAARTAEGAPRRGSTG